MRLLTHGNLYIGCEAIFRTLPNVTGVTKLRFKGNGLAGTSTALADLTSLTSVSEFSNTGASFGGGIKLPANCKVASATHCRLLDFSNYTENIDYTLYTGATPYDNQVATFSTIPTNIQIKEFKFRTSKIIGGRTNLQFFADLYVARGTNLKLQKLTIENSGSSETNFTSLDGLQYVDNLNYIAILSPGLGLLKGLNDISALSKFASIMTTISLPYTGISDILMLSNFTALNNLNLEYCSLVPYMEVEVEDEDGNVIMESGKPRVNQIFTLPMICNRMRTNAGSEKVTLRLKGNNSITDWSTYTDSAFSSYWDNNSSYGKA